MNRFLLFLFSTFFYSTLLAQSTETISVGANYANATYYKLSDGSTQSHVHNAWDIAFGVFDLQTGGIFINESQSLSASNRINLFLAPSNNFADTISSSALGAELKNAEKNWSTGAFNENKDLTNFADYGWGVYNMSNHKIEGSTVYVLQLRNGDYKKIMVDALNNGTYHFKYANLDGSNLQNHSIAKNSFSGQTLAYFSLSNDSTVLNIEPNNGWDLLFTRYEVVLDNAGTPYPYMVMGVLSNQNVAIAKADGINPATVDINNYINSFSEDSLTIIGHSWKTYDFSTGWVVDNDLVYFAKTEDSTIYKLRFLDFSGSSTGVTTLEKTNLGNPTAVQNIYSPVATFDIYPNPIRDRAEVLLTLKEAASLNIVIHNAQGQQVQQFTKEAQSGLNALELSTNNLSAGVHLLSIQSDNAIISKKIIIQK